MSALPLLPEAKRLTTPVIFRILETMYTGLGIGGAGLKSLDMPGRIDRVLLRLLDPQPSFPHGGARVLTHWLN